MAAYSLSIWMVIVPTAVLPPYTKTGCAFSAGFSSNSHGSFDDKKIASAEELIAVPRVDASSKDMESGILRHISPRSAAYSTNAPPEGRSLSMPAALPQTRSPILRSFLTADPIATMTPATSKPNVTPGETKSPKSFVSTGLRATAMVLTRIVSGSRVINGMSWVTMNSRSGPAITAVCLDGRVDMMGAISDA